MHQYQSSIAGGTVRYVDVQLLPCPEAATIVGECQTTAALEIVCGGRTVGRFPIAPGDQLLVADGTVIDPDTMILHRPFERTLRATTPVGVDAIAHWSEPLVYVTQRYTELPVARAPPGSAPIRLELRSPVDDTCLVTYELWRNNLHPLVPSGTLVRRGDPLATLESRTRFDLCPSFEALRALLDAHALGQLVLRQPLAIVSPCDGTIEAIDPDIVIRASDGRRVQLRRPRMRHVDLRVGDLVHAGDVVVHGERNHHALLHAWGEHRLSDHILDELQLLLGPAVSRPYLALALRAMLSRRRVPGDTANLQPVLRGIDAIARRRRREP
jgi:hypothetical protein